MLKDILVKKKAKPDLLKTMINNGQIINFEIKKYSIIIFGHPRRIFEDNLYVDKFVDPSIDI